MYEHTFVVHRSYSLPDFEQVLSLRAKGLSTYAIAQQTGFPRSTVQNWVSRAEPPATLAPPASEFRVTCEPTYAYLLGFYLGDGHVWRTGKASWRLCIVCDVAYPGIIEEVAASIRTIATDSRVHVNPKKGAVGVIAGFRHWPAAFPQHGPGRKHERPIVLEDWQAEITGRHPKALLRGLIHSDGCRCVNRFRTKLPSGRVAEYEYPRYFFSNLSADIRRIFCEHCDQIGIRWTQSNPRNISVAHRRSVAAMDGFVGAKY